MLDCFAPVVLRQARWGLSLEVFVDLDCYFPSKNGFIQDQQNTAIQGLQPWQTTGKPPVTRRRKLFERKLGGAIGNSLLEGLRVQSLVTSHWLSHDSLSLTELLPGKKRKSFLHVGLGIS